MPARDGERTGARELLWLRANLAPVWFGGALAVLAGAHFLGLITSPAPAVAAGFLLATSLALTLGRRLFAFGRRFLWRVSHKLIVSYALLVVAPIVIISLLAAFFGYLAAGQLMAETARRRFDELSREVDSAGTQVADRLWLRANSAPDLASLRRETDESSDLLESVRALRSRYPGFQAHAVVTRREDGESWVPPGLEWPAGVPAEPPSWLHQSFPAQMVVGRTLGLEVRSAALRSTGVVEVYVEAYLPIDEEALGRLENALGTDLRILERDLNDRELKDLVKRSDAEEARLGWLRSIPVFGVVPIHAVDWDTGELAPGGRFLVTQRTLWELGQELYGGRGGTSPEDERIYALLVKTAILLVAVALVAFGSLSLGLGVSLARSITGAVHELSEGTGRIERGDFGHRIRVWTDDQLGDLSVSFNRMAVSVEREVRESAERERLEEELRIGRVIQQSLLPAAEWCRGPFDLAAMSLPAREVGGDYFDFFELGGDRLGLLVADVSGKGTEAAFYMAEVKGVMLAVSRRSERPCEVLAEANDLLGSSLDRRSFVSMAYAVLDLVSGRIEFGRAGQNPILYRRRGANRIDVLQPAGMALGIERKGRFAENLEPGSLALAPDDLVVLYTDGVTDTIGVGGDFYEQVRLERALLAADGGSARAVRDQLVADLRSFARPGLPHDDLTLVVLHRAAAS